MPNLNVGFAGTTLIRPGSYYQDNVNLAFQAAPPTTPPLIFIGYGYGQKPQTPVTYANGATLTAAMRGGPSAAFVPFMMTPSPELFGAQLVTWINVGENTQSSLALNNAAGSGVAVLTSTNYGLPSNLLQAQVTSGSLAGKQVTLYDGFAASTIVGPNLGVPFVLAYTGTATGVTFTVTTSGLNATQFATHSPNTGESLTILLGPGNYATIGQVVQYLNGSGFYSALIYGDGSLPATYLDSGQSNVSLAVSGSGGFNYSNVTAALGSVIYWVNQYATNYATAAISGTITTLTSGLAPANIPFTSFSGATSVPPTNNDYATAFNLALTIPGWAVVTDSNAAAVVSLGTQHAITASTPTNASWRRYYTGSSIGDSVNFTITTAQEQDSNRTIYVYPGIWAVNPTTGVNTLYGGLYAAAAVAGMSTGNPIATPLTNKVLLGTGVEVLLNITQINQLQQAGVMCIFGSTPPVSGSVNFSNVPPTVVSDFTTWQVDNNPENVFEQQMKCRDWLAYSLVNALQPYVGSIADIYDEVRILSAAKNTLNSLVYTPGSNGVLASWAPTGLFLTYNGSTQTASISAAVTLVGQNRFITEFINIYPLNLTISAASLQPSA